MESSSYTSSDVFFDAFKLAQPKPLFKKGSKCNASKTTVRFHYFHDVKIIRESYSQSNNQVFNGK